MIEVIAFSLILFLIGPIPVLVTSLVGNRAAKFKTAVEIYHGLHIGAIFFILLTWLFQRFWVGEGLADIGLLLKPGWIGELLLGSLFGLGVMSLALGSFVLFGWYKITDVFWRRKGAISKVALGLPILLILQILLSFGEELGFRGLIFHHLLEDISLIGAILISSVIFALFHVPAILQYKASARRVSLMVFNLFLMGGLWAYSVHLTGYLWFAIGFHAFWNFSQWILGLEGSEAPSPDKAQQKSIKGLFEMECAGPEIITGGAAGLEGGLAGTLLVIVSWIMMVIVL